jgi:hypothetical protein
MLHVERENNWVTRDAIRSHFQPPVMEEEPRVCSKKGCHQELPSAAEYVFRLCEKCRAKARAAKQKQAQRERERAADQRGNEPGTPSTTVPSSETQLSATATTNSNFQSLSSVSSGPIPYLNAHAHDQRSRTKTVNVTNCQFWPFEHTRDFFWHYQLLRAVGPPPSYLGLPGDIYVDQTPDNYQLFGKTFTSGWLKWAGPSETRNLVVHPHQPSRFLWCSTKHSHIGWVLRTEIESGRLSLILDIICLSH